jgi:ElaB/YqjD/DUF883 family membrane-anchored ribosome-binding protein
MREGRDADDPQVIRENIERTRAQMSETIDRIQYRLDPSRLRNEAEDAVREATIGRVEDMAYQAKRKAKRAQRGMINKVKENPVPAALIGLGLGWLMMSGGNDDDEYEYDYDYDRPPGGYGYDYEAYGRSSRYMGPGAGYDRGVERYPGRYERGDYPRYAGAGEGWNEGEWQSRGDSGHNPIDEARERVGDMADAARSQVRNATHAAQDQVEHLRDRVQEEAGELRDRFGDRAEQLRYQSQRQMQRTKRTLNQSMESNPLMIGALALAAGALIGLSVPSTEMEDQWIGEKSERLREEAMNKVKHVASEAQEAIKDAAEEVGQGKSLGEAAKDVAGRTQQKANEENLTGMTSTTKS